MLGQETKRNISYSPLYRATLANIDLWQGCDASRPPKLTPSERSKICALSPYRDDDHESLLRPGVLGERFTARVFTALKLRGRDIQHLQFTLLSHKLFCRVYLDMSRALLARQGDTAHRLLKRKWICSSSPSWTTRSSRFFWSDVGKKRRVYWHVA